MRRVTATEARRGWFRLLDEVAGGEVVVIERNGVLVELHRAVAPERDSASTPDYAAVLRVAEPERAAAWGWEWSEGGGLDPVDRKPS